jgi:hypothetical protein
MPVGRVALPPIAQAVGVSVTRRVIIVVSSTVRTTGVFNGQVVKLVSDTVNVNDGAEEPVLVGKNPVEFSDNVGIALDATEPLAVGKRPVEFVVIGTITVDAVVPVE